MRNLVVDSGGCVGLGGPCPPPDADVLFLCTNSSERRLFAATASGELICYSLDSLKEEWRVEVHPPGIDAERVTSLAYALDLDAVCLSTASGQLVLVHPASREVQEVGSVDGGVVAMEWSPDGEVLAMVTGTGSLLVMSQEWDALSEVQLLPGGGGGDGWAPGPGELDDASLTWRGDGKYFATSVRTPPGGDGKCARSIKVWDRSTFELHSTAEAADRVGAPLAWQPNGRHLYAVQDASPGGANPTDATAAPGQHRVLLFERNGLLHTGFDLPAVAARGPDSVAQRVSVLSWSPDSELLAVLLAPAGGDTDGGEAGWSLQLWHRSNWHWYLKQGRRYGRPPCLVWDDTASGTLHVVSGGGYERLAFVWDRCVSDRGTAVVVDGDALLLTPLAHAKVPPPMCSARARLPAPAAAVAISSSHTCEDERIAVATADGALCLFLSVEDDLWEETLEEEQEARGGQAGPRGAAAAAALEPWVPRVESVVESVSAGTAEGGAPQPCARLAGGRAVRALAWLAPTRLLALASPSARLGDDPAAGDLLFELELLGPPEHEAATGSAVSSPPWWGARGTRAAQRGPARAGFRVVALVAHGTQAGCAVLHGDGGRVSTYTAHAPAAAAAAAAAPLRGGGGGGVVAPAGAGDTLPMLCPWVAAVPLLPRTSSTKQHPLLIGLSESGALFWGASLVAAGVTSFAVRTGGAGGPALLYTTRKSHLYTVFLAQLASGSYAHVELTAAGQAAAAAAARAAAKATGSAEQLAAVQLEHAQAHALGASGMQVHTRGERRDDDMRAAMHVAMRPSAATAAARDVVVRAVEQGSVLVAAPKDGVTIVLQMPRGNLEGVSPRALVLAAVACALRKRDYAAAWEMCTTHRVDLNLLADLRWPQLLDDLPLLVKAVPRPTDLCDLLFALRPGSVVAPGGVYASIAGLSADADGGEGVEAAGSTRAGGGGGADVPRQPPSDVPLEKKVDALCEGLRAAVEASARGGDAYVTVVATCHARCDARRLDGALACVKAAKEEGLAAAAAGDGKKAAAKDAVADAALKHLLLHVEADELYRVALGMYELPLAYMVASASPRDPGEYLDQLARFRSVGDRHLRHHAIDVHLGRWAPALASLYAAGEAQHFAACLKLATEKGLLRSLLALCGPVSAAAAAGTTDDDAPSCSARVLDAYGDVLVGERKHEDAAVAYVGARQYAKALQAYRDAGSWRSVFVMAARLKQSPAETHTLAVSVAQELAFAQPAAAAQVLLDHVRDVDSAVALLAGPAREWRLAAHACAAARRPDLLDSVVAPGAAAAAAGLLSDCREAVERLGKYGARLAEVRGKRAAMEAVFAADAEEGVGGQRDDDAASDINSLMTGMSMYTDNTHVGNTVASSSRGPSTQGGRKANKKPKAGKAKGGKIRQGSPQEEAALVELLTKTVPSADQLSESGQLTELLVTLGHFDDARTLQRELGAWLAAHTATAADLRAHPVPGAGAPGSSGAGGGGAAPAAAGGAQPEWKWAALREP
ncbi:hypothetical protein FOA52_005932 [Chlamydomonas sp. UWO 241]|nr:hypothetical protein FOA52_005932 [Chlamydomonas sp. UWO 241]